MGMLLLSITFGIVFAVTIKNAVIALLWWAFAVVAIIVLFLVTVAIILAVTDYRNSATSSEIKLRVKVLDKRQLRICGTDSNDSFIDFITFEFPDGTREELSVGTSEETGLQRTRIRTDSIFHITAIDDTGILTYRILDFPPRQVLTVHQEGESRKKFVGFKKEQTVFAH